MRQKSTFTLLATVVAILMLSVAYAAITNIQLTVSGNVTATPDQANFKVMFTGTPSYTAVKGSGTADVSITGDTSAIMNVSGLTAVGDTLTATFTVENRSSDITAYVSSLAANTNTDYFTVTSSLAATEIAPEGGTTTLTVTVKLIKTPVTEKQTDSIKVSVIASPTSQSGKLMSFSVDNTTCYATEGMTWGDWIKSSYNTIGAFAGTDNWGAEFVLLEKNGHYYQLVSEGPTHNMTSYTINAGMYYSLYEINIGDYGLIS